MNAGRPADVDKRERSEEAGYQREDAERELSVAAPHEHHDRCSRGQRNRPQVCLLDDQVPEAAEHERQIVGVRERRRDVAVVQAVHRVEHSPRNRRQRHTAG
jgi:hypothetical protein